MAQNKMMDMALANVFGKENTTSYVDALVAEDEMMISNRIAQKNRRATRVDGKKKTKIRNKRIYDPSNVRHWGTKATHNEYRGITPVFHGQDEPVVFVKKSHKNITAQTWVKVHNRKERYSAVPTEGRYLCVDAEAIFHDFVENDSFVTVYFWGDEPKNPLMVDVNSWNPINEGYYSRCVWPTVEEGLAKGYLYWSDTPQYRRYWDYDNYEFSGTRMAKTFQTAPLGESIRNKVLTAWDEEKYNLTMEADWELTKIAKSIKSLMAINHQLQSEKLGDIINNLADNYSRKF